MRHTTTSAGKLASAAFQRSHLSPGGLAQLLEDAIRAGRYPVGERMPTELELQAEFGVSRYCVRAALQALKDTGMVSARAGIGHAVLTAEPEADRYMQGSTTLPELVQSAGTVLSVLGSREVVVDAAQAQRVGFDVGAPGVEITALRSKIGSDLPMALLVLVLRPAHAAMASYMDGEAEPLHMVLERRYGVRIDEVQQRIVAVDADARRARLLKLGTGQPCLDITRRFLDSDGKVIFGSMGLYPGERFSHDTAFKVRR